MEKKFEDLDKVIDASSIDGKVVRMYFYRWRIEEYFRAKKQEYKL